MSVYNIAKNIEAWNINSSYDTGVIVKYDNDYYESLKSVPCGINIGYSEYWKKFTVEEDINELKDTLSDLTNITYDEDEIVVGTWFDGEPIYQIRFTETISTPSTNTLYPLIDLTDYHIDSIVKLEATYNCVRTETASDFNIWCSDGSQITAIYNIHDDKKLEIRQYVGGDSSVTGYVTLWYTKEESEG